MRVGRVIGRVVLNQRIPELPVGRWLLVSPFDRREAARPGERLISGQPSLVVYDDLGAGEGDLVGFTEGGEAAKPFARPVPVDAYNCCLLDAIEVLDQEHES
ncbi:MAG: EutN/CcmL family microcompartment protein [Puniceicoccaceae bacterium]